MTIAGIIRKYREQNNITQADLADMLGCTHANVSHFERGATLPRGTIATRLAKLTGFNLTMFLTLIERERIETKIERLQERLRA